MFVVYVCKLLKMQGGSYTIFKLLDLLEYCKTCLEFSVI